MPITCADRTPSETTRPGGNAVSGTQFVRKQEPVQVVCDVMEPFFKGLQTALLRELVVSSLHMLQAEFFDEQDSEDIRVLETMVQTGPLYTRLTILLFLLNVHVELKDRIMRIDPGNARKLVRFMSDMRKQVVMAFCVDERQKPHDFVQAAHECYILA